MHSRPWTWVPVFGIIVLTSQLGAGEFMKPAELQMKNQWVKTHLPPDGKANADALPFSFTYGDKSSAELLAAWPHRSETVVLDKNRTQRTDRWTDPKTALEVRV